MGYRTLQTKQVDFLFGAYSQVRELLHHLLLAVRQIRECMSNKIP